MQAGFGKSLLANEVKWYSIEHTTPILLFLFEFLILGNRDSFFVISRFKQSWGDPNNQVREL